MYLGGEEEESLTVATSSSAVQLYQICHNDIYIYIYNNNNKVANTVK